MTPVIKVQDLVFSYPRATEPVVRGMSFEVAPGEIFGLLGPSGAGKSTTQKILISLLKDYRGSAALGGPRPGLARPAGLAPATPLSAGGAGMIIASSSTTVKGGFRARVPVELAADLRFGAFVTTRLPISGPAGTFSPTTMAIPA